MCLRTLFLLTALSAPILHAQDPAPPEKWNLYYQATSIGQYHGTFNSPYSGPFSLEDHPERDVSLTGTLFFGLDLSHNTQFYFDPEIAGGRGGRGVSVLGKDDCRRFGLGRRAHSRIAISQAAW